MYFPQAIRYKTLLFSCLLLVVNIALAQTKQSNYTYEELYNLAYENKNNPEELNKYLKEYYHKSIQENSPERLTEYYRDFVFLYPEKERLKKIDSALYYANTTQNNEVIGRTYLTKGAVYYSTKDFQEALNSYILGYNYITKTDNDYLKNRLKNHIGIIKNYLGSYEEAIKLFEQSIQFFKSDLTNYSNQRGYINSSRNMAWSYTKLGQIERSDNILNDLYHYTSSANISSLDENYIIFNQGINAYYSKNYNTSIQKIKQTLPQIYENEDFAWGSIGELFLAKSYWNTNQIPKAIPHLLRIDQVFTDKNYTHPDLRKAYEMLIKYYESEGNKDKQLFYTNRLIQADKVLNSHYKTLSREIYHEYETKDLLQAKRDLEFALYLQKYRSKIIISVSLFIIFVLGITYFVSNKRSRNKARELITQIESLQNAAFESLETSVEAPKPKPVVADELAQNILTKLQKLEEKEFFLKKDITLSKLAKRLKTNSTYLSAVINKYKNKNFSSYFNELRINYIAKEILKMDIYELQKYSIDAFAERAGYSNVKSFSDAFQKELDIKPSLFIREVIKRNQVALVA